MFYGLWLLVVGWYPTVETVGSVTDFLNATLHLFHIHLLHTFWVRERLVMIVYEEAAVRCIGRTCQRERVVAILGCHTAKREKRVENAVALCLLVTVRDEALGDFCMTDAVSR